MYVKSVRLYEFNLPRICVYALTQRSGVIKIMLGFCFTCKYMLNKMGQQDGKHMLLNACHAAVFAYSYLLYITQ